MVLTERLRTDFAEDCFLSIEKPKKKRKKLRYAPQKSHIELLKDKYLAYISEKETNPDDHIVFGCYLYLYAQEFGEDDPEWVVVKPFTGLFKIKKMANDLTDGNYVPIIEYLETLIPLWANRLRNGESFPNMRPTFDTLLTRRKIWAQRHMLSNRWKND